jgi:hypothetical protein
MSVKSVRYFIRSRTMNSFNLIQALMSLAFLVTFVSVNITLMLVNMFVFNGNVLVNCCNVLYICK